MDDRSRDAHHPALTEHRLSRNSWRVDDHGSDANRPADRPGTGRNSRRMQDDSRDADADLLYAHCRDGWRMSDQCRAANRSLFDRGCSDRRRV
jgi:hypothetical protein